MKLWQQHSEWINSWSEVKWHYYSIQCILSWIIIIIKVNYHLSWVSSGRMGPYDCFKCHGNLACGVSEFSYIIPHRPIVVTVIKLLSSFQPVSWPMTVGHQLPDMCQAVLYSVFLCESMLCIMRAWVWGWVWAWVWGWQKIMKVMRAYFIDRNCYFIIFFI